MKMSVNWFFRVQEKQNGNERQRLQHESSPYAGKSPREVLLIHRNGFFLEMPQTTEATSNGCCKKTN